jgi:hypothetical protein
LNRKKRKDSRGNGLTAETAEKNGNGFTAETQRTQRKTETTYGLVKNKRGRRIKIEPQSTQRTRRKTETTYGLVKNKRGRRIKIEPQERIERRILLFFGFFFVLPISKSFLFFSAFSAASAVNPFVFRFLCVLSGLCGESER